MRGRSRPRPHISCGLGCVHSACRTDISLRGLTTAAGTNRGIRSHAGDRRSRATTRRAPRSSGSTPNKRYPPGARPVGPRWQGVPAGGARARYYILIGDEFDAFIRAGYGGCEGWWATATKRWCCFDWRVWCCFLDWQDNGTIRTCTLRPACLPACLPVGAWVSRTGTLAPPGSGLRQAVYAARGLSMTASRFKVAHGFIREQVGKE